MVLLPPLSSPPTADFPSSLRHSVSSLVRLTMSSKRGRKRNDNLPPNRARDVQRAFRARRAAHLQALEDRVAELEEENDTLRAALNLPPANRPPLGRGPTGKDKAKPLERSRGQSVFGEGSASPQTTASSPRSGSQRVASTSQVGNLPDNSESIWENALTMPSHDELTSENVYSSVMHGASTSANYPPEHFRFDVAQHSRPRAPLQGTSYPTAGPSGYHQSMERSANSSSAFTREQAFSMMTVSTAGGNRSVTQSSPGMQQHSMPRHMESTMSGGAHGGHSPMGSHGSSFSPASPAPTPNNLNMTVNVRRSMNDPQHVASYVNPYSSASYQQRAHSVIHQQTHNNASPPATTSRLPPGHVGVPRTGFSGPQLSPGGDSLFRRAT